MRNSSPERELEPVLIWTGEVMLEATLGIPQDPHGVVVLADGGGGTRHSSQNLFLASELLEGDLATLLVDLLTPDEEQFDSRTAHFRLDIPLLTNRVAATVNWLLRNSETRDLPIGFLGSGTACAAAICAAASGSQELTAIVSRGGRPDLAGDLLLKARTPTLLVVGERDFPLVRMNREAYAQMRCEKRFEIVTGASRLFEEEGAVDKVAHLAHTWLDHYLVKKPARNLVPRTVERRLVFEPAPPGTARNMRPPLPQRQPER